MMHPTFGEGEVTALIEPQKIDVLFRGSYAATRIHARMLKRTIAAPARNRKAQVSCRRTRGGDSD